MRSLKLETKKIDFDGRVWELRCNMSVLDRLEQAHDGNFTAVMTLPPSKATPEVLAAMLNDYAEDMGWDILYTPKQISKMVTFADMKELDVIGMLYRAVIPEDPQPAAAAPTEEGEPGN